MGSFVYAIPDRYNPSEPLCTALYTTSPTLDFATRMAKVLARKTGKSVHVGNSVSLGGPGSAIGDMEGGSFGGVGNSSVEEEMEAFRLALRAVMAEVEKRQRT